jgi:outer membrane cobalamin receptor
VAFREDQFNTFQGNPALRPEYTDAYELGYQHQTRWGSVQLAPYYRRTPDAVRYVRTVDSAGIGRATQGEEGVREAVAELVAPEGDRHRRLRGHGNEQPGQSEQEADQRPREKAWHALSVSAIRSGDETEFGDDPSIWLGRFGGGRPADEADGDPVDDQVAAREVRWRREVG